MFLEIPQDKIDVAVQTDIRWMDSHRLDNIQNVYITSNCMETSQTVSPIVNSNSFYEYENITEDFNNKTDLQIEHKQETVKEKYNNAQRTKEEDNFQIMDDETIRNEDENTQDSLLQHMEDMFCESDDSSDLMKLIEKHSGVTKTNIDKEISEMCLKADTTINLNHSSISKNDTISKSNIAKINTNKSKISFSRYKELRNKRVNKLMEISENKTIDSKQNEKVNAVWFVERVHQVSKLKDKMTQLSLMNYRKHGRIKEKFLYLFGESDEEEMMPNSPICIEEYLPACKERIAPWIVKYLMPFYKKRRIKNRQLFKAVAKYIADMLIIDDTFPGKLNN